MILSYRELVNVDEPVPFDTNYKLARKPAFLDQVKISHIVNIGYLQTMRTVTDPWISRMKNEVAIAEIKLFFPDFDPTRNMPDAARLVSRGAVPAISDEVFHVIGSKTICEGLIWKGYGSGEDSEPTAFNTKRIHKVAIVTNGLNVKLTVLITDLTYLK